MFILVARICMKQLQAIQVSPSVRRLPNAGNPANVPTTPQATRRAPEENHSEPRLVVVRGPRAYVSQMTPMSKSVTKRTSVRFIFHLVTQDAFPGSEDMPDIVMRAMTESYSAQPRSRLPQEINRRLVASSSFRAVFIAAVSHPHHRPTPLNKFAKISRHTSTHRGALKTKAQGAIGGVYKIPGTLNRAEIRSRVLWLLEKINFVFGDLDLEVCFVLQVAQHSDYRV